MSAQRRKMSIILADVVSLRRVGHIPANEAPPAPATPFPSARWRRGDCGQSGSSALGHCQAHAHLRTPVSRRRCKEKTSQSSCVCVCVYRFAAMRRPALHRLCRISVDHSSARSRLHRIAVLPRGKALPGSPSPRTTTRTRRSRGPRYCRASWRSAYMARPPLKGGGVGILQGL